MKKFLVIVLPLILTFIFYNIQQKENEFASEEVSGIADSTLYLPLSSLNDDVQHYTGFSLCYNENYEQANWVAYELTKKELQKNFKRKDKFIADPNILTGSAENDDYHNSGYTRGHLAPAGDMTWSELALAESFYFSNISPQKAKFNNGIWRELEEDTRRWVKKYKSIHIVTGPVFTNDMQSIGKNKVAVPKYFFKALLIRSKNSYRSLAFIIPHDTTKSKISDFMVSIDQIEKSTGLDLFNQLPDSIENIVESKVNKNFGD